MKILVTGATGFIGSHLVVKLRLLGHDVITLSRRPMLVNKRDRLEQKHYAIDLGETDQSKYTYYNFENLCLEHKPEVIFHLASSPIVKINEEDPHGIILDNIVSTQKVVHYAPRNCKVVLASSVVVYGDWLFDGSYTDQSFYHENHRTQPTSIYGVTKKASESILETYTNMDRIEGVSARLCATVGGGLTHGVIKDFIRKLKNDDPILLSKSNLDKHESYNVVPDNSINIEEVAEVVMKGLDIYKPIKWLGEESNWKGDNKLIQVKNKKLKLLGWNPKFADSKDVILDIVSEQS